MRGTPHGEGQQFSGRDFLNLQLKPWIWCKLNDKKEYILLQKFQIYVEFRHVYLDCKVKGMEIKFHISSPSVLINPISTLGVGGWRGWRGKITPHSNFLKNFEKYKLTGVGCVFVTFNLHLFDIF